MKLTTEIRRYEYGKSYVKNLLVEGGGVVVVVVVVVVR